MPARRLSPGQVRAARRARKAGVTIRELSLRYQIDGHAVRRMLRGDTYKEA